DPRKLSTKAFLAEELPPAGTMVTFFTQEVQQLLHNKFVVIVGDSVQRSVYKDLVLLLQKDALLSQSQLKAKVLCLILADFQAGPQPDVVIINSCLWDVSRYGAKSMMEYRVNLEKAFNRLDKVLPHTCLLVWNMTMPVGHKIIGGFLIPELQHQGKKLPHKVIEGNFYGAVLASTHHFDVLDLHYYFRFDERQRSRDGVHWNRAVHRRVTHLLLAHVADAWGVEIPEKRTQDGTALRNVSHSAGSEWDNSRLSWTPQPSACPPPPPRWPPFDFCCPSKDPVFQEDSPFLPSHAGPGTPLPGYISFDNCPGYSAEGRSWVPRSCCTRPLVRLAQGDSHLGRPLALTTSCLNPSAHSCSVWSGHLSVLLSCLLCRWLLRSACLLCDLCTV
uniref:PC-esterase domain containing 1A n=1 Tax=Chelonoidis abingdonii TaxID=106734 RepID=A0A8C0J3B8_CHEAB